MFEPLKEKIAIFKAQQENMPSYQRRFIRVFGFPSLAVMIFLTLVVVIVSTVLEVNYGEDAFVVYIPVIVFGAIATVWIIAVIVAEICVKKRLVRDRADELGKTYFPIPIEQAEEALKRDGIINDEGFFYSRESGEPDYNEFMGKVCPFEKSSVAIFADYAFCKIRIHALILDNSEEYGEDDQEVNGMALSNELYNFIIQKNIAVENREFFDLLIYDKKKFFKAIMRTKINL